MLTGLTGLLTIIESVFIALGGLHVTALFLKQSNAGSFFIGNGEDTFPKFLVDFKNKRTKNKYSIKKT